MIFNEKNCIYLQIADYICEQILSGVWKAGDRALSVRELAVVMEVNFNTTMRSYDFLEQKGIVYNKRGIGFFFADDAVEKIHQLRKQRFMNEDLPMVFKNMQLLGITIEEVATLYRKYLSEKK